MRLSTIFAAAAVLFCSPIELLAQNRQIALVLPGDPSNAFWSEVQSEMTQRVAGLMTSFSNWDAGHQIGMLTNAVQLGATGIALAPLDDALFGNFLQSIDGSNRPAFVVLDAFGARNDGIPAVGTDEKAAGGLAGSFFCSRLQRNDEVAILFGDGDPRRLERAQGAADQLSGCGLTVINDQPQTDSITTGASAQQIDSYLDSHRDLRGVFAVEDEIALAVVDGLRRANRSNVFVVGFGATDAAMTSIQRGGMTKTIAVKPREMGRIAADYLTRSDGGVLPPFTDSGSQLVP